MLRSAGTSWLTVRPPRPKFLLQCHPLSQMRPALPVCESILLESHLILLTQACSRRHHAVRAGSVHASVLHWPGGRRPAANIVPRVYPIRQGRRTSAPDCQSEVVELLPESLRSARGPCRLDFANRLGLDRCGRSVDYIGRTVELMCLCCHGVPFG